MLKHELAHNQSEILFSFKTEWYRLTGEFFRNVLDIFKIII